jgi:hypothetical protein
MGQADQLLLQSLPQAHVRIDISVKINGSEVNSSSRVEIYNSIGVDPAAFEADIFDLFFVSDDGTDVTVTEITLTGLCDVMPMRWEWSYDEESISSPGTFNTVNETWDFDGISATRTFSATSGFESIKGFQAFDITNFICPT